MKNAHASKHAKKFRRPLVAMTAALSQGVIDVRHGYKPVAVTRPTPHKSDTLLGSFFHTGV